MTCPARIAAEKVSHRGPSGTWAIRAERPDGLNYYNPVLATCHPNDPDMTAEEFAAELVRRWNAGEVKS